MQRLFSSLLIPLCLLCPLLTLLDSAKADNDLLDFPTLCDPTTESAACANLGNIGYWGVDQCAAFSSSFQINCTSDSGHAYWEGFIQALDGDADKLGAPALDGISQAGNNWSFVNLSWDLGSTAKANACAAPLPAESVNKYVPDVINLSSFANSSFLLSYYNHILLLNCTDLPPSWLPEDRLACAAYEEQCGHLQNTPCAQIPVPTQELMLHQALSNYSCSHFQLFVAAEDMLLIPSNWSSGLIQLVHGDLLCVACLATKGQCIYNTTANTFQECHRMHGCRKFGCNTTAKIAVGVALTLAVAMVLAMLLILWANRKRRLSTKSFSSASSNHLITQRAYMLSKKFGPVDTREFSFEVLSEATKCFADENMIGDGGFGAVYLGILRDGRKVAVKRLYHDNFKRMDHFYNEIQILSKLNHPNLVELYGFCCQDSRDLLLVFAYASNGTVSDQLHNAEKPAMPWKIRLNIARETAEALSYLHNLVTPPIYHRDVKTTNILLDDGLHAKLADFGLSRLVPLQATHVSTDPQGTPGYLDPEYHQCYQLTDKSDVYSFGVVLAELVSAKMAVDMSRERREINLSSLALMKIGCGQWEELVDPRLEMKKNPDIERMVKRVVELLFMCLHAEKDSRPTMKHVAETLTSMCKEFDYRHDDDANGGLSFKVDIKAPASADETSQLIKPPLTSHSTVDEADSPLSSVNWTSSNASSFVNSF